MAYIIHSGPCDELFNCVTDTGHLTLFTRNGKLNSLSELNSSNELNSAEELNSSNECDLPEAADPIFFRETAPGNYSFLIEANKECHAYHFNSGGKLTGVDHIPAPLIVDLRKIDNYWFAHSFNINENIFTLLKFTNDFSNVEILQTFENVSTMPIVLRADEYFLAAWIDDRKRLVVTSSDYKSKLIPSRVLQAAPDVYYLVGCWISPSEAVFGGITNDSELILNYYKVSAGSQRVSATANHLWKNSDYSACSYNVYPVTDGFILTMDIDEVAFYQRFTRLGYQLYPPRKIDQSDDIAVTDLLVISMDRLSDRAKAVYVAEGTDEEDVYIKTRWIPISSIPELTGVSLSDIERH